MRILLSAMLILLVAGCAGLNVQWVASYSTANASPQILMPVASAAPIPAVTVSPTFTPAPAK